MREREQRQKWEATVTDWRELHRRTTLEKFQYVSYIHCSLLKLVQSHTHLHTHTHTHTHSGYMESDAVHSPPDLEKLRGFLSAEQGRINRRREGLLQELASLRPPAATKVAMYEWMENVSSLHKQLGVCYKR